MTLNDLKDDDKEYIGDDVDIEDEDGVAWEIKDTDYIDWWDYYDYDTDEVLSDSLLILQSRTSLYGIRLQ